MEDLHMTPPDTRIRVLFILGESSMDALCMQETGRAYLKEIGRRAFSVQIVQRQGIKQAYSDADLVVTDNLDLSAALAGNGFFVAGYQPDADGGFFDGASYVIQSFEDADAEGLLNAYRRWKGIPVRIGETKRLLVRESTKEDYPTLSRILSEVREPDAGGIRLWQSIEEDQYLAYIKATYSFWGFGLWTVTEKNSGETAGWCGLIPKTDSLSPDGRIELGYVIAEKWRRQGFGTEACREILRYAAQKTGIEEIWVLIDQRNKPSLRLAEKLGFKEKTVIPASACGINVPDADARLSVRTIVLRRKNL
ncbi:GNAT family N-acetyltransferase [Porcincola intestinalis]|uniref:GNAT family N-acetyltransferase n=1 Tax=Porcincola intestinalis TaxID=2606632 RepID=UPI0023EF764A|nr:GNAT family N-acetyltransferase [Porcincola intestinalis]MDD7059926.1 GNAT family N-acetyltransferase [Porcincola intestinalis]MDY5283865.1 GNAT family N-acetyltransferase [Porcincola intestinalis]